jgi:hypothetical protein
MVDGEPRTFRQARQQESVERFTHKTLRTDWDVLANQIHARVIHQVPFALAVITRNATLLRRRLVVRANEYYPIQDAVRFVRKQFRVSHYDAIIRSADGLVPDDRYDMYKVVDAKLGLPLKSLVYVIQHAENKDLTMLLIFGGERLEGQIEFNLETLEKILVSNVPPQKDKPADSAKPRKELGDYGELINALRNVDVKTLDQMDLHTIARLVNGLEGIIEQSPVSLRAKYRLLNDYLLDKVRD